MGRPPLPVETSSGRGRKRDKAATRYLQQRHARIDERQQLVEEAIWSLNTLYSGVVGPSAVPLPASGRPNLAQETVARHLCVPASRGALDVPAT